MALIKCPECEKQVSNMSFQCPHCGYPISRMTGMYNEPTQSEIQLEHVNFHQRSDFEINDVSFNIEEIRKKLIIKNVSNIVSKVRKKCNCDQRSAENVVYGYFLSTHGTNFDCVQDLEQEIAFIKSFNGKKLYCPYCLSKNIDVRQIITESISKGKSEIRKKSAVTRAANKAGRAGMIMATGGLWALTPKKSGYKEVNTERTQYHTTTTRTCMDCGMNII